MLSSRINQIPLCADKVKKFEEFAVLDNALKTKFDTHGWYSPISAVTVFSFRRVFHFKRAWKSLKNHSFTKKIGPSFPTSRALRLSFKCGGLPSSMSGHYVYLMLQTMAGYQLKVCVCRIMWVAITYFCVNCLERDSNLGPKPLSLLEFETWRLRPLGVLVIVDNLDWHFGF